MNAGASGAGSPGTAATTPRRQRALLLAINAIPLLGVLLFDWSIASIMLLFWAENVLVGVVQVLKLWALPGDRLAWTAKPPLTLFFCLHYGLFCLVHGFFVLALFVGAPVGDVGLGDLARALGRAVWIETGQGWALAALTLAYAAQFVLRDLPALRESNATGEALMREPYSRIIVLHIAILVGGGLAKALGSPLPALVLLIALKTALDLAPKGFAAVLLRKRR
jgi:hypothetical protein